MAHIDTSFSDSSSPRRDDIAYLTDPDAYIYKVKDWHQKNFDSVSTALEETRKQLVDTIAKSDDSNLELTFTRLYSMIMGIWIESRIHVLLYENGAFTESERAYIYNANSLENKWKTALSIAVKKSVKLPLDTQLSEDSCDFSIYNIYKKISEWISEYFSKTITYRNKIAHGQWISPFNSTPDVWNNSSDFKISSEWSRNFLIADENLLSIAERGRLLRTICTAINNLSVQRRVDYKAQDFNMHFKLISSHIKKLNNINYQEYKRNARQRYMEVQTSV